MPTCAVLGCTSGYRSNPNKSHLFRVPRNPEINKLWEKAIEPSGVKIRTQQSVCQKHFRADEILWQRELKGSDGKVLGIVSFIILFIVYNCVVDFVILFIVKYFFVVPI